MAEKHAEAVAETATETVTEPVTEKLDGFDLWHHGDTEARGVEVDFAVNVVSPYPPDFVVSAMNNALARIAEYPDERAAHAQLAAHLGVAPDSLLLVNGVAEAFTLIAAMRPWTAPAVVHPQFTEPEAALRAAGHAPHRVILSPESDFSLGSAAVPEAADLMMVGNPTNPTSRLHPADRLLELCVPGRLLVVDEAFIDVTPDSGPLVATGESLLPLAATRRGILVLRSLTKTFGLAGIRAGYVVGHPAEIACLARLRPPWSVNSLALAAVQAIATRPGDAYVATMASLLEERRPEQVAGLAQRGFQVVPGSAGPFLLARHPRAATIRRELRDRGVAVRRGDTFPGLDGTWVRLALRGAKERARLFEALDAILRRAVND